MAHAKKYEEDAIEVFQAVKSDGFEYVPSEEEYGTTIDEWDIPEEFVRDIPGCDDFALACRALLKQKGCNPQLAFFRNAIGNGSLVCMVGTLVLDIQHGEVSGLFNLTEESEFIFVALCGREPGDNWNFMERGVSPLKLSAGATTYTL